MVMKANAAQTPTFTPSPLRGEGWGGGAMLLNLIASQRLFDGFDNAIGVFQNVMVPEAQNAVLLGFEPPRAFGVFFPLICMLPAIHFDDKRFGEAGEIDDVAADGHLSPELETDALALAQA